MSPLVASLLGFAVWTLLTLLCTVGIHRWSRILSGRAQLVDFPADAPQLTGFYRRGMRAHANCLESLPVFTAIVVAIGMNGVSDPALDVLPLVVLGARVGQTLTHVSRPETNFYIGLRFAFFLPQVVCMLWMAGIAWLRA